MKDGDKSTSWTKGEYRETQSAEPKTEYDTTKSGGTSPQPSDLIQDSTTEAKDDTLAVEQTNAAKDQKPWRPCLYCSILRL